MKGFACSSGIHASSGLVAAICYSLPTFVLQLRTLVEGGADSLALPAPQGFNHHQLLSIFTGADFWTVSAARQP
jgi:hypothetical protein